MKTAEYSAAENLHLYKCNVIQSSDQRGRIQRIYHGMSHYINCVSPGKTVEEALEKIEDAIWGCLDLLSEREKANGHEKIVEVVA